MINNKSIEDVIGEYNSKIQNVIKKFNKAESDVEDIKQEVYIKTWKNISKFNKEINQWGLLKRITVNTCIDHFRTNKKHIKETYADQDILNNLPSPKATLEQKVIFTERHKQILNSINKLNPKLKEVITLYDIEELSYEEISNKLNCPVGTVKSRLFNARKVLKEELKDLIN